MILFTWNYGKGKRKDRKWDRKQIRHWEQERGLTIKGHEEIFGGDRNVLYLDGDGYMTECIYKNS